VSATLATARPEAVAGRSTFLALAARELRRFVVNPIFLLGVALTAWIRGPRARRSPRSTR
jgi:hypothetical protein